MRKISSLVLALLAGTTAGVVQANTYVVTKTTDTFDGSCDSDCSLREQAANSHRGPDNIRLAAGVYTLTTPTPQPDFDRVDEDDNVLGDLDIKDDLSIVGPYGGSTIIDGGRLDRVMEVFPGVIFTANNLTITHGVSSEWGGALYNAGTTTLTNTVITGNQAASGLNNNRGGGIANIGTLVLDHCRISFNAVSNGETGQGIGGGIYNSGTLTVRRSTISSNTASDDNDDGNGAGLYNTGSAFVMQSLFTGNFLRSGVSSGNAAVSNAGLLEMSNTTSSGNLSTENNGGVVGNIGGTLKLSFVTIADNSGGGLRNTGTLALSGTLIAGNSSFTNDGNERNFYSGSNCVNTGSITTKNSLLGLDGSCTAQLYVDNGTVFTTLLEPLRLGGGVTETHKLRAGSAAVDAINPFSAAGACEAIDQRSARRPPNEDGRRGQYCDIGAYELRQ